MEYGGRSESGRRENQDKDGFRFAPQLASFMEFLKKKRSGGRISNSIKDVSPLRTFSVLIKQQINFKRL